MGALTPANWTSEFVAKMTFVITQELPYPNPRIHYTLGYADTTRLFHRQVVSSHTGGASDLTRRLL
jgi:hypothetical protein